jgi:NTP pyrophosphatase (non-canonical NTP hydrolase)
MQDKDISAATLAAVRQFVTERDWDQFHNPKDMAISLSLEAAELLELFQWSGADLAGAG